MEGSFESKPRVCFQVEKILGVSSDGSYQVQWAPAWVSRFHLVGCEHLIQEFLQRQCEKEIEPERQELSVNNRRNSQMHMQHEVMTEENSETVSVQNYLTVSDSEYVRHQERELGEPRATIEVSSTVDTATNDSHFNDTVGNDSSFPPSQFDEMDTVYTKTTSDTDDCGTSSIAADHGLENYCNPNRNAPSESIKTEHDDDETIIIHEAEAEPSASMVRRESSIPLGTGRVSRTTITKNELHYANKVSEILDKHFINTSTNEVSEEDQLSPTHSGHFNQGKQFVQGTHLNNQYVCTYCGLTFSHKYRLDKHVRTHTGLKPFQCSVCNKSFSEKGNLKRHVRLHTGERPYSCASCGKAFTDSSDHKKHYKRCSQLAANLNK